MYTKLAHIHLLSDPGKTRASSSCRHHYPPLPIRLFTANSDTTQETQFRPQKFSIRRTTVVVRMKVAAEDAARGLATGFNIWPSWKSHSPVHVPEARTFRYCQRDTFLRECRGFPGWPSSACSSVLTRQQWELAALMPNFALPGKSAASRFACPAIMGSHCVTHW